MNSQWRTRLLHLLTGGMAVTGLVYFVMKYWLESNDPFAVVNHPWQAPTLKLHLILAPCFIFAFGLFWEWHVARKIRDGTKTNALSGWASIACFLAMTMSGYWIQISEGEGVRVAAIVSHVVSSCLFTLSYLVHQWVSFKLKRRAFFSTAGARAGAIGLALAILLLLLSLGWVRAAQIGRYPEEKVLQSASRRVWLMGTVCDLEVFGTDRRALQICFDRMVRTLQETDRELTTWSDSPLSRANRAPLDTPVVLPPRLYTVLLRVKQLSGETGGAFDPAIGPLVDVWGIRDGGRRPTERELALALSASRFRNFRLADGSLERLKTGSWIDSGGFGKGEALDRLGAAVSELDGIAGWSANLGGQIHVSGINSASRPPWDVDLADPLRREPLLGLMLREGSLAVSGGSERSVSAEGVSICHILDPRTGYPAAYRGEVAVWNASALVADVMSTALFVMGPEKGLGWAESRGLAACFVTPDPTASGGFRIQSSPAFAPLIGRPKPLAERTP